MQKASCRAFLCVYYRYYGGSSLFSRYFFLNGDDSTYHVYRIFKIKETLDYGIFPAVIYPTGLNGNSSLGVMYPYLFLYIPAFTMKILGASLVQAVQYFIVLISIATALVAYYSLRSVNVSGMVSVLFTLLYVFMNYRLENVYHRFAMGEYLAMVFFPLLLAGLYHIAIGDKKKWWILTLAMTGLMQSHILSFLVGAVIAAVVGLCYMVALVREQRIKPLIYSIIIFLLLNIWFMVPFIQCYLFGDLNTDIMPFPISKQIRWTYDPTFFFQLIDTYDMNGYEYFSFGIPTTAVIFMTILFHVIHEKKDGMERKRQVFTFILTIGAFAMFFLLCIYMPYYKLEEKELLNTIFGSLQFLWRLLGPSVGMILFAFAILLSDLKLQKYYKIVIIASLSVLVFINVAGYSYYYEKKNATLQGVIFPKGEEMPLYYSKILDVPYGDVLEYRVVYTNKETLTSELKTSGDIDILNYNKDYLKADIQYVSSDADANVTIPLQKYIGYKAYDEEQNELVMKRSEYGTIQIDAVPDGQTHEILVRFREPIIWRISELVSLLSCIVLISSRFVDYKKLCNKLGKVKLLPKHNK